MDFLRLTPDDAAALQVLAVRGGKHQRKRARLVLVAVAAPRVIEQFDSVAGKNLILRWATGELSAPAVQQHARDSYIDQLSLLERIGQSPDHASNTLRALGSLGSNGKHVSNIHRQLMDFLGEPATPKAFLTDVPINIEKPRGDQSPVSCVPLAFLLPHLWFHFMFTEHRARFDADILGGSEENLRAFWTGVRERRDPRLKRHPMGQRAGWADKAVPISLHGDAVPVMRIGKPGTRSLDVMSWMSALAVQGTSMVLKNYIFGVFEECKCTDEGANTMLIAWAVVVWSLWFLYLGIHPTCDFRNSAWPAHSAEFLLAGQPLASEFFGVIWLLKSDLDYVAKCLFMRHYNANVPCDFCPCDKNADSGLWPTNFGPASLWMDLLFTTEQWHALGRERLHSLFSISFLSAFNVEPDELHVIHLGTSQYFFGSVLWLLVFDINSRLPPADAMARVWRLIVQEYMLRGTASQFTNLHIKSFIDPEHPRDHYPKLSGKGAEVKGLCQPLYCIWKDQMDLSSPQHKDVLSALGSMCEVTDIIDDHSHAMFYPTDVVGRFRACIGSYLRTYCALALASDLDQELLFNVAPKFHWLWHLGERSQYIATRRGACFLDEDYVGSIKEVGKNCAAGTQLHEIPNKVVESIRMFKSLIFQQ
jgi:hypothetical protein